MALVKDGIKMIEPQILTNTGWVEKLKKSWVENNKWQHQKKKKSCKQNMNDNINRKHLEHMSVLFSLSKTFLQCLFSQQQVLAYFLQLCSIRCDRSREICKNLTQQEQQKLHGV